MTKHLSRCNKVTTELIFLFVFLASQAGFSQKYNYDSLKNIIASTKSQSSKMEALLQLADWYHSIPDSQYHYGLAAKNFAAKIKDRGAEAYAMGCVGESYKNRGNYVKALSLMLPIIKTFEELKDSARLANTYNGLAIIYGTMGNRQMAKQYFLKAFTIARLAKSFQNQLYSAMNVAAYYRSTQPDSSIYFTNFALRLVDEGKANWSRSSLLLDLANTYYSQHQFELADEVIAEALTTAAKDDRSLPNIQMAYSKVLLAKNKADSALYYANLSRQVIEKNGVLGTVYQLNKLFADIYAKKGDFERAYQMQGIAIQLKDSILNASQLQQVANLTVAERENEIELRNANVAFQNKLRLYAVLGVLTLAVISLFFLFNRNKKQQKANNLLQKQKQQIQETLAELRTTQSQLIQSEKMASLGELTAGIAHEIQNPLNFVNNFSDVNAELIEELKIELNSGNKEEAILIANDIGENEQKINHHGKRADAIVKGMLQHSRANAGKKELTDINALADEYLRLSYHGLRAKDKDFNATIETNFDEGIGKIEAVPQDIGRVLLNLYNNAFYAVNEKKKAKDLEGFQNLQGLNDYQPTVIVTTKRIGDKVEIVVKDNGSGIPQKVVDKIFQPFFTTKPTGQGTGLGLSLSYDIIKAHGGEIKVESKEGEGSKFIIQLPIT